MSRLDLPAFAILLVTAAAATPGLAADLGLSDPQGPYGKPVIVEERRVFTVVPDCRESRWAVMLRCRPRQDIVAAEDIDLIQIERSVDRPRRRPYPELVPR